MPMIPIRYPRILIDGVDRTHLFSSLSLKGTSWRSGIGDEHAEVELTPQAEIDAVVRRMMDGATLIDPDGGRP